MSSGVETRTIPVGSGRDLCLELAGEPDGTPILFHPGEPMSRRLYGGWITDAEKKGIRLISYDRPGYGGSTAHPGYTVEIESLLSPADAEVLTGDLARWLTETNQVAVSPGDQGWWDDGVAHMTNWGFDLRDIQVPVKIWHGRPDRFVPVQHGEWLAATVPGAEADISDRDGHLTMIGRIGEIHDWLLQHF